MLLNSCDSRVFVRLPAQWLSFQNKSAKWETDNDTLHIVTGCLTKAQTAEPQARSTGSSYSNPLFMDRPSRRLTQRTTIINQSYTPGQDAEAATPSSAAAHVEPHVEQHDMVTESLPNSLDSSSSMMESNNNIGTTLHHHSKLSRFPTDSAVATKSLRYPRKVVAALERLSAKSSLSAFCDEHLRQTSSKSSHLLVETGAEAPSDPKPPLSTTQEPDTIPSREIVGSQHADVNAKPTGLDPANYSSGKGPPKLRIPLYDHPVRHDANTDLDCNLKPACTARSNLSPSLEMRTSPGELRLDSPFTDDVPK